MDRRDLHTPNASLPAPHGARSESAAGDGGEGTLAGRQGRPDAGGRTPRSIAVDLTRLLPGGVNGGAKLMTLELVARLARLAPEWRFLLLTSAASHAELAALERENVRRACVQGRLGEAQAAGDTFSLAARFKTLLRRPELSLLRWCYGRMFRRPKRLRLLAQERIDCLFLPLTAPLFYEPGIPSVAVVYDLQHVTYPEFFSFEDRYYRDKYFRDCMRSADHVICISDYARKTVLRRAQVPPERLSTIYIGLAERLPHPTPDEVQAALARWNLEPAQYFLYPANSWPHKNHHRLFEAYAQYLAGGGRAATRLVCPGADTGRHDRLRRAIEKLGLVDRVILTGYLPNAELAALYVGARAIVFPSLYEGFGMPVVEAMAYGKPVLCSNTSSLPEIAAGAALLFDPHRPEEIAAAMRQIEAKAAQTAGLVQLGRERVAALGTADEMAAAYLEIFERVCAQSSPRAAKTPDQAVAAAGHH